jgi:uncharacterized protein YecE (DUF72 family)
MAADVPERVGVIRVGLSGWSYRHWQGSFYPDDLPATDRLAYVARRFRTVEVNRSFYSFVRPHVYASWRDEVDDRFVFAVKGSRYITHQCKLHDVRIPLANFFASGILELGEMLGPVLWQFPQAWKTPLDRLDEFLGMLPRTGEAALELARHHDERVPAVSLPSLGSPSGIRHAVELRNPAVTSDAYFELLARHDVAAVASQAGAWPTFDVDTASFSYARLHGPARLYDSSYPPDALAGWEHWSRRRTGGGRDVFVYFDNDGGARAPTDALALQTLLRCGSDRDPARSPSPS